MKIYLYIDADDLDDIAEPMGRAISDWLTENEGKSRFINRRRGEAPEQENVTDWDLGLLIETGRRADLKAPLAFLYDLAKQYECDFVVGFFDATTGRAEKVCYFGNEEGRPDHFEIASYLGLKR